MNKFWLKMIESCNRKGLWKWRISS